jgi:hypothetical protein
MNCVRFLVNLEAGPRELIQHLFLDVIDSRRNVNLEDGYPERPDGTDDQEPDTLSPIKTTNS